MSTERIELSSLVGEHVIDGRAEFVGVKSDAFHDSDPTVMVLRLDGKLYWFQEDPGDGYRSGLDHARECAVEELPPGSFIEFPPIDVTVEHVTKSPRDYDDGYDTLRGVMARGVELFEIGTANTNDYYPSFVCSWTPPEAR